ncbi:riboflavin synthase [Halorussus gelatinilyticus]|uniref:Riboflavin synthase n=1 Tax=Halorussus gelatinilyticus TaxID=2937524 RepID=A0A8U0ICN9_9EURY|nr:riboflavin synthase [Halorussus gelatinilyticus]UPV98809.1 riboflavin synthase [Halorussus gelatinilyticus]
MFTGIVEEAGEVRDVTATDEGRRLRIAGEEVTGDLDRGQSVSVSGVCLTVEDHADDWFEVFLASETVAKTYLGEVEAGDPVNLERAMPADGRFDGHVVQGHVDTTAEITAIEEVGEDWTYEFAVPEGFGKYVVDKGSVTVDGISLTVAERGEDGFSVAIIPETRKITNLSAKAVGDPVHLEVDVIAKYAERLLDDAGFEAGGGTDESEERVLDVIEQ